MYFAYSTKMLLFVDYSFVVHSDQHCRHPLSIHHFTPNLFNIILTFCEPFVAVYISYRAFYNFLAQKSLSNTSYVTHTHKMQSCNVVERNNQISHLPIIGIGRTKYFINFVFPFFFVFGKWVGIRPVAKHTHSPS
jgi:hypothetical protein